MDLRILLVLSTVLAAVLWAASNVIFALGKNLKIPIRKGG